MAELIRVNEQITVAGQPTVIQLIRMRNRGLRSIVNLRQSDEWDLPLSPAQEGAKASEFALIYKHFPVAVGTADAETARRFAVELGRQPTPTLVHDGDGQRSMALVLIALGRVQGWTFGTAFDRAEELGLEIQDAKLRELVEACLPEPELEGEAAAAVASGKAAGG